jgi:hypothetical protein
MAIRSINVSAEMRLDYIEFINIEIFGVQVSTEGYTFHGVLCCNGDVDFSS